MIYNGTVYVGVGSTEESLGIDTTYVPTFRGTIAALDLATGAIRWSFTTVPPGYSGGGSWGSNPVVSPRDGSLFVATGNNYSIPAPANACVKAARANVTAQLACLDPTDYIDAVLALDLKTGALKWSRRLQGADTWTNGCNTAGLVGCPTPRGADADFASAPNLLSVANFTGVADDRGGTSKGVVLGAGQKSGIYWGLNPANGGLFWSASVGHGAIQWGSAADLRGNNRCSSPWPIPATPPTRWPGAAACRSPGTPAPGARSTPGPASCPGRSRPGRRTWSTRRSARWPRGS